jgi:hypothetical protein
LNRLDGLRARAFATRDAALLNRVYVPGPLRRADAVLLGRLVPPGCGLADVRTRYTGLHATAEGHGAVIVAVARLPASHLACDGRPRAAAPGTGPTRLRIALVRTPEGLRIGREEVLSGPTRRAARSRGQDE